ncbi:MAG: PorV/PorQ family protein [Candidatus Cloacimonadaceae bacterium]|nr:PorV/PorQ family protein [Candidatus Cloacimonadaceae bacterium]MDP3115346.1 PorV/PorQ family protein [Candidatus Cloacimonadaceae bacterium]
MMKHFRLILILSLLFGSALCAQTHENTGLYGYKFLNISTNPLSLALGGRGIHAGGNLAAFINQPASAAIESHRSAGISHTAWLDDIKYNNVFYSQSDRLTHFGLALRNLDYGEIENRDVTGNLIGYYSPLDISLMASYAYRMGPATYFGLNGGVMYQKLNTASSYGVHADLGMTLLPPVRDSRLSFSFRNLGTSSKMEDVETRMPITFETDLSKAYTFESGKLILEASAVKPIDADWKGIFSSELEIYEMIALRGAYKLNHSAENFSTGIGIKLLGLQIDYAWAPFTKGLNDVHAFGVSYNF